MKIRVQKFPGWDDNLYPWGVSVEPNAEPVALFSTQQDATHFAEMLARLDRPQAASSDSTTTVKTR